MDKIFKKGDFVEKIKSFSAADVRAFADLSGDVNPVHLSDEFAAATIFKRPIVHGFLYGSIISELIANQLPGPGSIYKSQVMNFLAPVYHDQVIKVRIEIKEIIDDKKIFILNTTIVDQQDPNKIILTGEAVIKKISA